MTILEEIANRTGKSRDEIAIEVGWSRMTLYTKLKKPGTMSVNDINLFAKAVRRSPRNIYALIIKNHPPCP